jgi:hypothetical protein
VSDPIGTALIAGGVGLIAALLTFAGTALARTSAPYKDMADRLALVESRYDKLSAEVTALRDENDRRRDNELSLVDFAIALWDWAVRGAVPPGPIVPRRLHSLLDPNYFTHPEVKQPPIEVTITKE